MNDLYFSKVKSIRRIKQKVRVYNFDVPKYETYIANGICVHNCQNFEISQVGKAPSSKLMPIDVINKAKESGALGIAFTYSEPFIWYEYVMDVAACARQHGLKTVLKTNGYGNEKAFEKMFALMDAVNIDVKGSAKLYKDIIGIDLSYDPEEWIIIRNLRTAYKMCHTEISTIAIPPYCNDDSASHQLFFAIREATSRFLPIHILKFFPDYKLKDTLPPTDLELHSIARIAEEYFHHVYIDYASIPAITACHSCGAALIDRKGIEVVVNRLERGRFCYFCHTPQNIGC